MDTIVAQVTPPGFAGVGIIRVSGPCITQVMQMMLKQSLHPRYATLLPFYSHQQILLDQGIAIFFPKPHSFTGEDVLELQAHGGPVLLDCLIQSVLQVSQTIRLAKPGEFSERAFLNDKLDLTQAEAVSDLIHASSEQAVHSAAQSLQGAFSKRIHGLVESLCTLRMHIEARLDFVEENIEPLEEQVFQAKLDKLRQQCQQLIVEAKQGALLREGMTIVLLGEPNVGKSSLLNCLSNKERAIVTDVPGTTRDTIRETIQIDGLPIDLIDTAGVHATEHRVEKMGIERTRSALNQADRILLVVDIKKIASQQHGAQKPRSAKDLWPSALQFPIQDYQDKVTIVFNKIDQMEPEKRFIVTKQDQTLLDPVYLSAKTGIGIAALRQHLKRCVGFDTKSEGLFMARSRHLEAIKSADAAIVEAAEQWHNAKALELCAACLQEAQQALGKITGEYRPDDLLGKIFSEFCIGK